MLLGLSEARADNVDRLSQTLHGSGHDKARIAAAVSLGRLEDKRAVEPLVRALRDSNRVVRAVAAAALGHLGDPRALPALQRATKDKDKLVRKRASEAIAAIRSSQDRSSATAREPRKRRAAPDRDKKTQPTIFLEVQSAADESRGRASKRLRKARAKRMRYWLLEALHATPQITLEQTRSETSHYNIDVSITRMDQRISGPWVEVECQIRVAISNERGKMLSFLTGGAKVQVPKRSFKRKYLYRLQLEAIQNAVKSVHQDVVSHLTGLNRS